MYIERYVYTWVIIVDLSCLGGVGWLDLVTRFVSVENCSSRFQVNSFSGERESFHGEKGCFWVVVLGLLILELFHLGLDCMAITCRATLSGWFGLVG